MIALRDRNGKRIQEGDTVEVQQTSGPYGQTRKFKARIIGEDGNHLKAVVTEGRWVEYGKYGNREYKEGSEIVLDNRTTIVSGEVRLMHTNRSYDHGHDTWVEVIDLLPTA